jgi:hypothetical protein
MVNDSIARHLGPTCLTILPTYKCTAACKNCCFGSHPWVQGRVPQADILRYIREAAEFDSMRLVCFSGGECFLLGDDLVEAIALANSLGLATRCVTNGYWATSVERALTFLRKYSDAGLVELNFSTGDNHLEFVPLERIFFGACASRKLGIGLAVMVEVTADRKVTKQTLLQHPVFTELFGERSEVGDIIQESPWIPMDDEAPAIRYSAEHLANHNNLFNRFGCQSVLSTLVVTPQKNLKACCGITSEQIPELRLGSLDNAGVAELYKQADDDFLKIWLAVDGPERILAWASTYDSTINWENRFAHQCHACLFMYQDPKVRAVIREHYSEVVPDVLLRLSMKPHA